MQVPAVTTAEVAVARMRPEATLPTQAYPGDAGLDLAACDRVELAPGARAVVGTGIAVALPEGHAGLVVPRSGLAARHGLGAVNAPGLIESLPDSERGAGGLGSSGT